MSLRARTSSLYAGWRSRTASLYAELAALATPRPWWWLIAAGVAATETLPHEETYLACDAEPDADTLIAYPSPRPRDVVADAIARARAARTAIRELDGTLPAQPLAGSLDGARNARLVPSALEVAAFAFADRCVSLPVDDPRLATLLAAALAGEHVVEAQPRAFACVSIGDEPLETARHGHRRAWTDRGGPWLGLGHAGDLAIVSTCHLVVDGYGHARLAARIAELVDAGRDTHVGHGHSPKRDTHVGHDQLPSRDTHVGHGHSPKRDTHVGRAPVADAVPLSVTRLAAVPDGVPLSIARRELVGSLPRVIPLAYRLGCMLQRDVGHGAAFSPTIQIPVALGAKNDPLRLHRRVVAASLNVRFDVRGEPEPFAEFETRVRAIFAREAASAGLVSRLLASGRAIPAPLGWKRRGIAAKRPAWLEGFADVIGGRALLSRISVDARIPMSYAVSSPSRMASEHDPVGGCVITLVDDGERGAITLCGSGLLAAEAILDELLDPPDQVVRPARVR